MNDKLVYTVNEMAKTLGIGLNKAYELIHGNQVHSLRIGRKILIPKKSLENWLESVGENC